MARESLRSEPHQRTRHDHSTETAEDYVEAVDQIIREHGCCRGVDLVRHFAVSQVTVSRIVERLQRDGLLKTEPYKPIKLTPKGRRLAEKCNRRHEIVYDFLLAIGLDEKTASLDAEGIEHHVSPATLKRFEQLASQFRAAADD